MNYKEYYEKQAGGSYPVFRGSQYQQGYVLGGMFKKFFRYILPVIKTHALPVLKSGAQTIGTEAIKTAANIATDAIRGRDLSEASRDHSEATVQNLSKRAHTHLTSQTGSGSRSYKKRKLATKNQIFRGRRLKDIFDKK